MTANHDPFRANDEPTRRRFLCSGVAFAATGALASAEQLPPELKPALDTLEPYFTAPAAFRDVSRGNPIPHTFTEDKRQAVGLTRETWRLQVVSDPEHPATLARELRDTTNSALTFPELLKLGEKHSVRFAKVMTCLNIGCPLGMGIWEGVPLREIVWLTQPSANLRRVFYHGYHNDDPKQLFRSSLPVGRVFEDYDQLPPVIVCYKLNGAWLDPKRGGPVRMVVPEGYGFKSVKWLTHVTLSNTPFANDTYAGQNNDVDSPLKTFAATLHVPSDARANSPIPVTGFAQVGVSGLSKVQVALTPAGKPWPADDPYFTTAPWLDGSILPPPAQWGGELPGGVIPTGTRGFAADSGKPITWPLRLAKAHWAALLPGVPAGDYVLRCRTIDANGIAQPLPRPFRKSGRCDIEEVGLKVRA